MIAMALLRLEQVLVIWCFQLSFLSMVIPKSLNSGALCIVKWQVLISGWAELFEKIDNLLFDEFNVI